MLDRRLVLTSESAILLVGIMFLGSLALWVGVPLGCLWIGAQIQAETGSVGVALFAMMVGMLVSVAALVSGLGWLGRKHIELLELRAARSARPPRSSRYWSVARPSRWSASQSGSSGSAARRRCPASS